MIAFIPIGILEVYLNSIISEIFIDDVDVLTCSTSTPEVIGTIGVTTTKGGRTTHDISYRRTMDVSTESHVDGDAL